ncbi:fluoride efflux transporter CrcB [Caldibacillus thermolactis]|jgi:fluoride exporter|uniref:Fluoride-specific ion channel FluC n=1 Tax=Pallidibacillus thermolactis TaxID=251051 RepID=A0ABT2WJY7_9BACI|nr:fluoride efflux transporter CrcB [Pallidibacillus thermolactis]MCU9595781.1 fluoride efflux transporter CrcB [Pallidibacillus thermolactis]MCU9601790.1 fluoride efflux transporter CrcB [Pallidibacillus thermolactis subsp. kokeshiiformis]
MMGVQILLIGIGGFLGAIARFLISQIKYHKRPNFPIGTFTVNVTGAFLLGIITSIKADMLITLLIGTGFLGAFTTFSTMKLEMLQLYFKNNKRHFLFYILLTYGGGLVLAYLGFLIGTIYLV